MGILAAGTFFAFAPFWASHIQRVWGHNLFATPDAMVLLGVTLLVSLLAYYLLPDFLVQAGESSFCRNRTKAQRFSAVPVGVGFGIGLLSLVGLTCVLYLVNQRILNSFLSSADEHSCYFLAECLRKGKLYVDVPPLADFFKVVHVGMRDGKWFSVYPPGWPLIWAFGLQFNIVDWLNPVISSLAIFFFYLAGIRLFSRWSVICGLILMCLSPFFMFTAASYFSHPTCLLCISIFLYAFFRWREARQSIVLGPEGGEGSERRLFVASPQKMTKRKLSETSEIFWASVCAFAVGYGLMTRYLTMAAVAGPFLLYHYFPIFFEWKGRGVGNSWLRSLPITFRRPQLRKSDWIAVGIILTFMILILYQNYLVTGKPFRAPNKHDKSWERLGFRKDYTVMDALFFLIARVFYLMDWFAPTIVALYFLIFFQFSKDNAVIPEGIFRESSVVAQSSVSRFPFKEGWDDKIKLGTLFRLSMVFIAGAYFFYYSWGGNQWGPRYLWEGMPFLCIAVADRIVFMWRNGSLRLRKFLLILVVGSVVVSGVLFVNHADSTAKASSQRRALYDLAENTVQGPAIVFIHGFIGDSLVLSEDDAVRNSPFLDAKIIYAHDLGARNSELKAAYPGRQYFRGTYNGALKRLNLEPI
jgi:hypothetical protein